MPHPRLVAGPRVVLVRPRRGGNVGAVARVMKNFGAGELWLVAPRARVGVEAARMAVHAGDVLAARRTAPTLEAAIADCALVVGTAGRSDSALREVPATPRAVAVEVAASLAVAPVAIVFGPEDHGLSNHEISLCQRLVAIPTSPEYPSMNLAQAASVVLYELAAAKPVRGVGEGRERAGGAPARVVRRAQEALPATSAEREAMIAHLRAALLAVGFLDPVNPDRVLADLRRLLARAGLEKRDVAILRGLARQITWAAHQIPGVAPDQIQGVAPERGRR